MPNLANQLILDRCPHCKIAQPLLVTQFFQETINHLGQNKRAWKTYLCSKCGGMILASANASNASITSMYPEAKIVDSIIPNPAKEYLKQAIDSLHAPAGSIMLSASSVDAMLKAKGYTEGGMYPRINKATEDHLITEEMAKWAHQVRLEANGQRHADEDHGLPTEQEAQRVIDFTLALAEFLFVLPSKVEKGIMSSANAQAAEAK